MTRRHSFGAFLLTLLTVSTLSGQNSSFVAVNEPHESGLGAQDFDGSGNLYAYQGGPTTLGALQTATGGGTCFYAPGPGIDPYEARCGDAYIGKIDKSGNVIFGTYLGGDKNDQTTAFVVDSAGYIYFTGTTGGDFPTTPGAAIASSSSSRSFAAKISPDGTRLIYSTYLPDTAAFPNAIALDAQGNVYIAGASNASPTGMGSTGSGMPITGHAFVLKLNADGSAVVYNTALAGSHADAATALHSDSAGNLVVAGQTQSGDFPVTANALQIRLNGSQNLFIARLDPSGNALYATFFGGSGVDAVNAMKLDGSGNIYVAGSTSSPDFPTTKGSFEPAAVVPLWNSTSAGGFVARFSADATALGWSTYMVSLDSILSYYVPPSTGVTALAVSAAGDVYVSGITRPGFSATPSAPQPCYIGFNESAFVAKLDSQGAIVDATYAAEPTFQIFLVSGLALAPDGSILLASVGDTTGSLSQIKFGTAPSGSSSCLSPAVVNSATFEMSAVVPGELITLTGLGIGPDTGTTDPQAVQVLFDGQAAPVSWAQSYQINAQAPVELSGKTQTNITVVYNQQTFGPITATVAAYGAPGVFRLSASSSQAAAENQDGSINGPANPAAKGSVVSVWGTGFGLTDPACTDGAANPPAAINLAASLGGYIEDGLGDRSNNFVGYYPVLYIGNAPDLPCGAIQINFQIPLYATTGAYKIWPASVKYETPGFSLVASPVAETIYVK